MTTNPNKDPLPLFNPPSSSPTTFSSLPDEIIVDILARISKSYYRDLCLTSKRFYSLLTSPEIYNARSQIGATKPRVYVCMWLPNPTNHRWYTLREIEDGKLSLVSLKLSSYYPKLLDTSSVSLGYEIYQIGGTLNNTRSKDVHVFNCWTATWRRGPSLTVGRKFPRCCVLDGKIYVIGGCLKSDKAMNWGEVLDLKTPHDQTWKPLKSPSVDDDTFFEVAVLREKLYVFFTVSGNNYAYDPNEGGRWIKDQLGFVGLEPLKVLSRAWCVIDNFLFVEIGEDYNWYDHYYKRWRKVFGLTDFYSYRSRHYSIKHARTVKLVNYGGKLLIIWDDYDLFDCLRQDKKIWCAVIKIEKRLNPLGITEIWGKFESCNSLVSSFPKSYKILTCLSVSI